MGTRRQVRHRSFLPQAREREGGLVQLDNVLESLWRASRVATRGMVESGSNGSCGNGEHNLPAFPSGYLMQVLLSFLKRLCAESLIVQTEGEPAIRELAEELAKVRQKPTRTGATPGHSCQSNGAVESAIGHLIGHWRTLRARVFGLG